MSAADPRADRTPAAVYAAAVAASHTEKLAREDAERYAAWAARRPAFEPEHYRERYVKEAAHFTARHEAACTAADAAWLATGAAVCLSFGGECHNGAQHSAACNARAIEARRAAP